MKILFVINNLYSQGNGLSASARRTIEQLKERGHNVRVMSGKDPQGEQTPDYPLEEYHLPLFDPLVQKQGFHFAKSRMDVIKQAVLWADVIHLEEPFALQYKTAKLAKQLHVPCVGTYHIHPENLFASVGLENFHLLNTITLRLWKAFVFDKCLLLQCPTENVRQRLESLGFKSKLTVISNGLPPEQPFPPASLPSKPAGFTVTTIGRFSREKDQDTLLEAMRYSRYAEQIHLIFAGKGPLEKKLQKKADVLLQKQVLRHPVTFHYCSAKELQSLYRRTDLYIHCATIEVEGLSCMEALRTGIVPVISEGKLSAASQFALNEKSCYKERDACDLAKKIDYWLEHEAERNAEAKRYRKIGKNYAISHSIGALEELYQKALKTR